MGQMKVTGEEVSDFPNGLFQFLTNFDQSKKNEIQHHSYRKRRLRMSKTAKIGC
jgi:hypothetical protein